MMNIHAQRLADFQPLPRRGVSCADGLLRAGLLKAAITLAASLAVLPAVSETPVTYTEVRDKLPVRGTGYLIRVPEDWNGTLINDLDYWHNADSAKAVYLLEHGYAMSGTGRRTDRTKNYDPAHEIHDFISIFDLFEDRFGKPKRIIQMGCSGGGTVTLGMAEIHPDRIDGAIAACAATSPWMANTHLDGLFVLKALLAPELPIVDLGGLDDAELEELGAAWEKVIHDAQKTAEGRARIALAITIGQWPAWGGPGAAPVPKPDPTDAEALQESMYHSMARLTPSKKTWGTSMLERAGRGQLRWNTGVDYKNAYRNGDSLYMKAVEALYQDAEIGLDDDLDAINAFPRIAADAHAVRYWSAPGRTHIGKPRVPLLRIHTAGDGLVYPAMAQGYEDLVFENGHAELFRSAYVDRWGHCSFSLAEWLAAVETMMQRLDTGVWPDTDPEMLNRLGASLVPDGEARFYNYRRVGKYNRTWVPAVADFIGHAAVAP